MILEMKKFGKILNSRPAGREAALRAKQIINGTTDLKLIVLDMTEVDVLTPSFADEFYNGIKEYYPNCEIQISGYESNQTIKDTLVALKIIQ
ncbi:hypothetical protein A2876_00205 [Candidatus Amesbacteria bacterium RIFCSPHIGHO2_01_FULL_48_32b]|uniref:DUF4325 domain-containing protein n=1 Tax=Candidatus Amesbacteria bacterium RIFCSPHIGHO2_01_FULL_48_32b TaxID=1797253 RepID=A0A1F4YFN1_9BACT|nr:MAG: hypothetical protein A2876_00205 [Candidatus Amesbacteria bacterium RIFCSPHIGHO2_01_FULL_48_32b]